MLLQNRPQNKINVPAFIPHSEDELSVFMIAIVTEGSVEELEYIKGFEQKLRSMNICNMHILYINDCISDMIWRTEERASHPKRRLELMKELLLLKNPDFQHYPDEAWMICDRDQGSFSEMQYEELIQECDKLKIRLVISNPAFQIWLLFHFESWLREHCFEDELTPNKLLNLIEKRLGKCIGGYKHGNLDFALYTSYVDNAVNNSRLFCTDLLLLKDEIGTNFADLVDSLKAK